MKNKFTLTLFFIIGSALTLLANDGAFFAKGNHLVPINNKNISLKKEILKIKINGPYAFIDVYYELYNPGKEEKVLVGFEAASASGDVDGTPKKGKHPYISDFTVRMNDKPLNYKVAIVSHETYIKNGIINKLTGDQLKKTLHPENVNEVGFNYVYHFDANFKPGLNIIKHTYRFQTGVSIDMESSIEYILTAANRWANKQIDDFTLIIENDKTQRWVMFNSFFKQGNEWEITGRSKIVNLQRFWDFAVFQETKFKSTLFTMDKRSTITFKKRNFHPKAELFLFVPKDHLMTAYWEKEHMNLSKVFDAQKVYLNFHFDDITIKPKDDFSRRVLYNHPFAKRGYVFTDKRLKDYYEKIDWYVPDPNYVPKIEALQNFEKKVVERYSK
ncbi:MAG TPA: YARHG domain-containing protein [Edaphocola sp.]|nr:YARHG domain-containing protein [Edaphocola sp.]